MEILRHGEKGFTLIELLIFVCHPGHHRRRDYP